MGITFLGGAAVASDTLRHNQFNHEAMGQGQKYFLVNPRVVVVKAGYGPDADVLWDILRTEPNIDLADSLSVFAILQEKGSVVYENCREMAIAMGAADPGLYLIVAGLSNDGVSSVHCLNFGLQDFNSWCEPGIPLVYASRFGANDHAKQLALSEISRDRENRYFLQLDNWAQAVTMAERTFAPHAIDFPVDLVIVRMDGVSILRIDDGQASSLPLARVRLA